MAEDRSKLIRPALSPIATPEMVAALGVDRNRVAELLREAFETRRFDLVIPNWPHGKFAKDDAAAVLSYLIFGLEAEINGWIRRRDRTLGDYSPRRDLQEAYDLLGVLYLRLRALTRCRATPTFRIAHAWLLRMGFSVPTNPNSARRRLQEVASAIISELKKARRDLKSQSAEPDFEKKIAVILISAAILPSYGRISRQHPLIAAHVVTGQWQAFASSVSGGGIAAAMLSGPKPDHGRRATRG
jgi:hypothetical protein